MLNGTTGHEIVSWFLHCWMASSLLLYGMCRVQYSPFGSFKNSDLSFLSSQTRSYDSLDDDCTGSFVTWYGKVLHWLWNWDFFLCGNYPTLRSNKPIFFPEDYSLIGLLGWCVSDNFLTISNNSTNWIDRFQYLSLKLHQRISGEDSPHLIRWVDHNQKAFDSFVLKHREQLTSFLGSNSTCSLWLLLVLRLHSWSELS